MTLPTLDEDFLRELTGAGYLARGVVYLEEGRVDRLSERDGIVTTIVYGTR